MSNHKEGCEWEGFYTSVVTLSEIMKQYAVEHGFNIIDIKLNRCPCPSFATTGIPKQKFNT